MVTAKKVLWNFFSEIKFLNFGIGSEKVMWKKVLEIKSEVLPFWVFIFRDIFSGSDFIQNGMQEKKSSYSGKCMRTTHFYNYGKKEFDT